MSLNSQIGLVSQGQSDKHTPIHSAKRATSCDNTNSHSIHVVYIFCFVFLESATNGETVDTAHRPMCTTLVYIIIRNYRSML